MSASHDNSTIPHVFTECPMWGQGGQYILNPKTGQRERVIAADPEPAGAAIAPGVDDISASVQLTTVETPGQSQVKKDKHA